MNSDYWQRAKKTAASAPSAARRFRSAAVTSGSASLGVARGVSILVSLVTIPILTRHLGADGFGIYATLTSLVTWLAILRTGFGPTLINVLSGTNLEAPNARGLVATSFWLQVGITAGAVGVGICVWPFLDWASLLNASPPEDALIDVSVLIVILGVALQVPLSLGKPLLMVKGHTNIVGAWEASSSVATLAAIVIVALMGGRLPAVLAVTVGVPAVISGGIFLQAVMGEPRFVPRLRGFARKGAGSLMRSAGHFTAITIAAAVIAATDNFIIATHLGPSEVTPYAVTLRAFQFTFIFGAVALEAYWPRYRAAFVAGDMMWLNNTHRRLKQLVMVLLGITVVVMYFVGEELITWWAGPDASPDLGLIAALSLLAVSQGLVMVDGRLLEASGNASLYAKLGVANAVVNLSSSLLLVRIMGPPGVALGTALGYAVVIPSIRRRAQRVLRSSET